MRGYPVLGNLVEIIRAIDKQQTGLVIVTPPAGMQTFMTDCLREKLFGYADRFLGNRKTIGTTESELLGIIVVHTICAGHNESPTTICDPYECRRYPQVGIPSERYPEF